MTVAMPVPCPSTATYVPSARPWHILRWLVVGSGLPLAGGELFGFGAAGRARSAAGPPGRPVMPWSSAGWGLKHW